MDARVLLLPCFGEGALGAATKFTRASDLLSEFTAESGRQIVLGLENTLSAEDNARLLERIGAPHAERLLCR